MRNAAQASAVLSTVSWALDEQYQQLICLYEKKLAAGLSDQWPSTSGASEDEKFSSVTVLFVDVLNYAALAEKFTDDELSELVRRFYSSAGDTVHLFGARHMQFVGEALLAIFVVSTDTLSVNHGLRAARAALGLVDATKRVAMYLQSTFASRNLPAFGVCVALRSGPVALTRLQDPLHGETRILPIGDAANATFLLQTQAVLVGWTVMASVPMLRGITGAVKTGGRAMFNFPGRSLPVDAAELMGIAT